LQREFGKRYIINLKSSLKKERQGKMAVKREEAEGNWIRRGLPDCNRKKSINYDAGGDNGAPKKTGEEAEN